jgi:hypothetical protein
MRVVPNAQEEAGLRRALEITRGLIARRCEEYPRTWSAAEGWKLGMEEVAYRLEWELHYSPQEPGKPGECHHCPLVRERGSP